MADPRLEELLERVLAGGDLWSLSLSERYELVDYTREALAERDRMCEMLKAIRGRLTPHHGRTFSPRDGTCYRCGGKHTHTPGCLLGQIDEALSLDKAAS